MIGVAFCCVKDVTFGGYYERQKPCVVAVDRLAIDIIFAGIRTFFARFGIDLYTLFCYTM